MKRTLLLIISLAIYSLSMASSSADSLQMHAYAQQTNPHFLEVFRPNYITTGAPLDRAITPNTSDIKFQISLKANVWRNMGNSGIDWFVGYTQTSLWNIYQHSCPFYDNVYNPGIYFEKAFVRDGVEKSRLLFGYEHKSNGRDDHNSRSINYLFATYTHLLPRNFAIQGKAWFGHGFIEDAGGLEIYNRYLGYFHIAALWASSDQRMKASLMVSPVGNFSEVNLSAEFCYRIGDKYNNPYFYVQLCRGYGEALRETVPDITPRTMLRLGICISPHSVNIF